MKPKKSPPEPVVEDYLCFECMAPVSAEAVKFCERCEVPLCPDCDYLLDGLCNDCYRPEKT